MAITRETVLHVAQLARLSLNDSEVDPMLADLDRIVGYIDQLSELNTKDVPVTSHIAVTAARRVADEPHVSLATEIALAQGPRTREGGFAVPAFVDEG
ncbi:MAG TPA: Asp-tRNA(Asn)/Glu-tRNA(Gln) amidotransferase subunit GatC [Polyangiaceae bacterium]